MTANRANKDQIGVLLFNLGGPERLEDVRPFLYNLFSDPDIIRLPLASDAETTRVVDIDAEVPEVTGLLQADRRRIPLRRITDEQAAALGNALTARGIDARVYVGMRYWHPFLENAIERIQQDRIGHLIVLPLYPQFSVSTTGSSLNRMNELLSRNGSATRVSVIEHWHDYPDYIAALAEGIGDELLRFPDPRPAATHIVFSAHSVPVRYIEEGDPYLSQTQQTVERVVEALGGEQPHSLSFQSKVGPVKWLRPSTDENLRRLAREGVSQVLLVPISFVSEHIETLYELDILYRGVASEVGLAHYRRVPALNCRADFIDALASLVAEKLNCE